MPQEIIHHVDHTGQERRLGLQPPDSDDHRKMRAGVTNIRALFDQRKIKWPTRSEWFPVDFIKGLGGKRLITNQRNSSGCTGWSAAQALNRQRLMRGLPWRGHLSGACIYAQINGGHDQGSVIIDASQALRETGTCLESEQDLPNIFENSIRPATLKFFEGDYVTADTFEEQAVGLMWNMIPQLPVTVGGTFERFSGDGVAGFDSSSWGNHSVHAGALEFLSSLNAWVFKMPNTWGLWGPFVGTTFESDYGGCCRITERHVNSVSHTGQSYVHVDCWDKDTLEQDAPAPR